MYKLLFTFLLIVYTLPVSSETFSCTHREICRLADILQHENQSSGLVFETLITTKGDPHEFEPSINDIKKLMVAPHLIVGPNELNPWMKQISYSRSKNKQLKTITLALPISMQVDYSTKMTEALGHFWLYPKIYCLFKARLASELKINSKIKCNANSIETTLANDLNKLSIPIILTHDALLPLFAKLVKNKNQIIAIKGSSHHEEASSASIKQVYDALKKPKVIWILEDNITTTENIRAKIRKSDIVITIDTAKSEDVNDDFSILHLLHKKLEKLSQ